MKKAVLAAALMLAPWSSQAQQAAPAAPALPAPARVPRMVIEIYRIAPGQHTAFLEAIAQYDEANRRAGLPPRQLYVHSDGASWDFLFIQPEETPDANRAALDRAWSEMRLPSGADFFLQFRQFIAEHTDTIVNGPTTAAAFLASRAPRTTPAR